MVRKARVRVSRSFGKSNDREEFLRRYKIWMDHPESSCHTWLSDKVYTDFDEAYEELKRQFDHGDGCIDFEIIDLETGLPHFMDSKMAEMFGIKRKDI